MAIDVAAERRFAHNEIKDNGTSITVNITTGSSSYNPITETDTGASSSTVSTYGVIASFTAEQIDNRAVLANDQLIAIPWLTPAGTGLTLLPNYTITCGGVTYEIVHIEKVGPTGEVILYKVQVRD